MKNSFCKQMLVMASMFLPFVSLTAQDCNNIIKVNVPSLAFTNFSFQYEKVLTKKRSFALAVRFRPEGRLPMLRTIQNIIDDKSIRVDLARIGNIGITPEYRFYLGEKEAPNGFYIGPFISYNHYSGIAPINYNDYDDVNHVSIKRTALFKGTLNTVTAGCQVGAQWKLSDKWMLDWWIVGPNFGIGNGSFNYSGPLNDIEEISMDFELNKIKATIPFIKIKDINVRQDNTGASFKEGGPWAGIRAMGINLGYKF